MRIAGASTTSAPSARSRAASPLACARARVTATRAAVQRAALEPGEPLAQRPRPRRRRVTAGGRMPLGRARVGDRRQRARDRALAGERPALDHGRGLVGRPPGGDQPARRSSRAAPRPCRGRACRGSAASASQSSAVSGLSGSSWPVTNATALGQVAVRHRDAGVGGGGDARGHARARPRRGRPASRSAAPPRRRGRTRTGRRP